MRLRKKGGWVVLGGDVMHRADQQASYQPYRAVEVWLCLQSSARKEGSPGNAKATELLDALRARYKTPLSIDWVPEHKEAAVSG